MGSLIQCTTGTNRNAQAILQMIKIAIKNNHQPTLAISNQSQLQAMVKNGKPISSNKAGILAKIIVPSQNVQCIEKEMKLILQTDSSSNSTSGLIQICKGYIIFPNAYYYGDIDGYNAEGQGVLYLPAYLYSVEGSWHRDSLQRGIIYKLRPNQFTIQKYKISDISLLHGEEHAIIKTQSFKYQGSIKLLGSTNFSQIMTGKGEMIFNNGNKYRGELVNGLFQTTTQQAQYTYAQGTIKSHKGFFKAGLREDRGIIRLEEHGEVFNINMKFRKGIPIENGILQVENIGSYQLEAQNRKIKVKQSINN